MNKTQQQRYESLYEQHVNALKRQGKSKSTIDVAYRDNGMDPLHFITGLIRAKMEINNNHLNKRGVDHK